MIFPELTTERLQLIQLQTQHSEALFDIFKNEACMKYWDDEPYQDLKNVGRLLEILKDRITQQTGISWGLILKEKPDEVIGLLTYNHYQKNGLGIIGYILNQKYWGHGIITEALDVFIQYGFHTLGVHRIEAHVESGNIASEKVLQKIGFQKEGLMRDRAFYKNKHQSYFMYSLLHNEFKK